VKPSARDSQSGRRGRRSKSAKEVFRSIHPLPSAGLTLAELRIVTRLEDLLDEVRENSSDEPRSMITITAQENVRRLIETTAQKSLSAAQRADLVAYREWLAACLFRLALYAHIGMELADPAVRTRVDQWASVRLAASAAGPLSKNRWTKRRSRLPDRADPPSEMAATAERSMLKFSERILREREANDLPGADWAAAITKETDALVAELSGCDVTARFISGLLEGLRRLPGQWPTLPSASAVKKRVQRLRKKQ
jgi:hypothetical protein